MEWIPLLIALTIVYLLVASITTFDIRMTQGRRSGSLAPDELPLPEWLKWFAWAQWIIFAVLLYLNWKYAIALFVVKFILKLLPVLETIGGVLLFPFRRR